MKQAHVIPTIAKVFISRAILPGLTDDDGPQDSSRPSQ